MIKTLLTATFLFLAVAEAGGKEIQFSAGMPLSDAVKILREIADDLSLYLDVSAGPNGKPAKEFCWELKDYDLVVWLYDAEDGKILRFGFWTKEKFKQSKDERYDQEETARRITLDTKKHIFKVEKFPEYFPKEALDKSVQSQLAAILFAVAESKEIEVPKKEVENLTAFLEESGFWKMPKDNRIDVLSEGKDWSRVFIEAIRNGEHRVRARWSPDYKTKQRELSAFVRLYTSLFQETGLWKKAEK
jgi:hypothetical protein